MDAYLSPCRTTPGCNWGALLGSAMLLLTSGGCLAMSFGGKHSTGTDAQTQERLSTLEMRVQSLELQRGAPPPVVQPALPMQTTVPMQPVGTR